MADVSSDGQKLVFAPANYTPDTPAGPSGPATRLDDHLQGIDDALVVLTSTAPVDVTKSAAVVGVSTEAARQDHKHDVSTAAAGSIEPDAVAGEGSATSLARSDHQHSIAASAPSQGIGAGNTEGSATSFARSDHDHTIRESGGQDLTMGAVADGEILTRSGTTIVGAAGGAESLYWTTNDAIFPATTPAAATSRNGHALVAFDDTTAESIILEGVVPSGYGGANLEVHVHWVAASATTGDVRWGAAFERTNTDIDTDSFATQQTVDDTTNGMSGIPEVTVIAFTQAQADGITAGDSFRLEIERVSFVSMVGDAQFLRVALVEA